MTIGDLKKQLSIYSDDTKLLEEVISDDGETEQTSFVECNNITFKVLKHGIHICTGHNFIDLD